MLIHSYLQLIVPSAINGERWLAQCIIRVCTTANLYVLQAQFIPKENLSETCMNVHS